MWWVREAARKQHLEMVLGMLGFFTVIAFVVAAAAELQGRPAGAEVLVLVAFLAAMGLTYRAWRRAR